MKEKTKEKKQIGGISIQAFAIPLLVIVAVIHVSIVLLIININRTSNNLVALMQRSGDYQIDATEIQASNTILSETSTNYILNPVNDTSPNVGPLMAYAQELNSNRRSPKVVERFKTYKVSNAVLMCVQKASEYSERIKDIQIHAISVMATVYPLPSIPELSVFSDELTPEELALSNEQRVAYARNLVLESDYAKLRSQVLENVTNCNNLIQEDFSAESAKATHRVTTMRNILWAEISIVIFVLSGAFLLLYLYIFKPLRDYSKRIKQNKSIKRAGRISEMRQLVDSFNGLWSYRNNVEAILRSEAEFDALTGLPNRYCLEHDLLKNQTASNKSMAIVMFDVNFLKKVNDTKGHVVGDKLIRTAGACIKECFGKNGANNCYRIGGDEFLSLLSDCSEEEINHRINKFELALNREKISVSVGYAFANKIDNNNIKELMDEADKNMYAFKKRVHDILDK